MSHIVNYILHPKHITLTLTGRCPALNIDISQRAEARMAQDFS